MSLRFLIVSCCLPAISASCPAMAGETVAKPNFVVILADDLGYGDLGCYGNTIIRTPHLDRMAAEGMRFTDFYVAQAVCTASRAALLTGCYPNRIGLLGALNHLSKTGISDQEKTIAQILKPLGYATAIYGKWHLGHRPQFLPTRHGFDDYFGLPYSNDMWPKHPTAKFPDLPVLDNEKVVAANPDMNQLTSWYTQHAVDFIRKNKDRPFFLYVPHSMPHVPLGAGDRFRGKSKAGLYGDVIEEIDWSMGQILRTLKELDLDAKTLVLFTSDNGPWLSYGNHAGTAGKLREGKATTWEGGVREPFIARWPGMVPAGRVCREPLMTIDILPTIAHITGAELPSVLIDGKNAWTLLHGDAGARSPQEAYFFYWERSLEAVRAGKWKLHFPHEYPTMTSVSGGDGFPGKYTKSRTELALYDLEADVGEMTNLVKQQPDIVKQLTSLAEKARVDLGDSATNRKGKGTRPPGRIAE